MFSPENREPAGMRFPGGYVPRADRFPMALPIRFRPLTDQAWREGEIENISGSGVLFRTGTPLDLATKIEFTFSLPSSHPGEPAATIHCKGHIVRIAPRQLPEARPGLAAAIERFRFSTEGRA